MGSLELCARNLTVLYVGLEAVLLGRLAVERLFRRYRFFVLLLGVDASFTTALLLTAYDTTAYFTLWAVQIAALAFCYFGVVLELYGLVLRDYPGIRGLFRWLVWILVPAAAVMSLLFATFSPGGGTALRYPLLMLALVMARTAVLGVLVALLVLQFILFWCPLTLSRNTVFYCVGYLVFFTAQTAAFTVADRIGARVTPLANVAMQALSCACLVFWVFTLSRKGEQHEAIVRAHWLPGEQQRLREVLTSFDGFLAHLGRRSSK
jgi:hypothetical protein